MWHRFRPGLPDASVQGNRATLLWLPGIVFAADLAAWHKAFEFTTLANLASIVVAVVGYLWLRERLGWTFVLEAAVALTGTSVLLGVDLGRGRDPLIGDALGLLTACFYASYLLLVKVLRRDFSVAQIMAYSSSVSAVGLMVIAYVSGEQLVPRTWEAWSAVVALALVSHIGGQGLI